MPGNSQTVVAAFTEMAPHYEETVDRELRGFWGVGYDELIERLLARLDLANAKTVLDVATGRGAIPLALARCPEWQGRAVGLDITLEMLRGAQSKVEAARETPHIRLICGSGMRLPFAAHEFDTVICALATHHMYVPTLLAELRRVLRPGGAVLLADVAAAPFWQSRTGRLWLRGMIAWYSVTQGGARMQAEFDALSNMLEPHEWQAQLLEAGFRDAELTVLGSRKKWYPSGVIISARAA